MTMIDGNVYALTCQKRVRKTLENKSGENTFKIFFQVRCIWWTTGILHVHANNYRRARPQSCNSIEVYNSKLLEQFDCGDWHTSKCTEKTCIQYNEVRHRI